MPVATITPGTLTVASAFPDPPFEVEPDTGFDAELMQAICRALGLAWRLVKYAGADFNSIFDGLHDGRYDAVISGTTITPERMKVARFSAPYLTFDQGIAVNAARHPGWASVADLRGSVVGIQTGNTSDIVARNLESEGAIAGIRYYPYSAIGTALDDLDAGRIGAVIKLAPVLKRLVAGRPSLKMVAEVPTNERIGIAVGPGNIALCAAVDAALEGVKTTPAFAAMVARWFGAETAP